MENDIEQQEAPILEEEVTETPEEPVAHEDLDYDTAIEKLKEAEKRAQTLEAQKRHFQTKAQKLEERKPEAETPKLKPDEEIDKRLSSLENERAKHTFGYENKLSPKEVDHIFSVNPNNPEEALKDPFIKGGIDAVRKQDKVKEATPSSSRSSTVVSGKSWNDVATSDDEQAKAKHFQKIMERAKK